MSTHPNNIFRSRRRIALPNEENPSEVIFEVATETDELGYGFARAEIKESQLHVHQGTREIYIVVKGSGTICLNDEHIPLRVGDCVVIEPGTEHHVHSGNNLEVHVYTFPAYNPEDHQSLDKGCEIKTY